LLDQRSNFGRARTPAISSSKSGETTSVKRWSLQAVISRAGPASGRPRNSETRTLASTTARITPGGGALTEGADFLDREAVSLIRVKLALRA
jgi:hypothetical protein